MVDSSCYSVYLHLVCVIFPCCTVRDKKDNVVVESVPYITNEST